MKNGKRLTAAQLKKLGYNQKSKGEWARNDSENRNEGSCPKELEQHVNNGSKRKNSTKKKGKESLLHSYRYRLVVHSYRTRLLDPSNACYKALEDCLVTYNYIPDDNHKYCDQPIFLQTKVKEGEERTTLELLRYRIQ